MIASCDWIPLYMRQLDLSWYLYLSRHLQHFHILQAYNCTAAEQFCSRAVQQPRCTWAETHHSAKLTRTYKWGTVQCERARGKECETQPDCKSAAVLQERSYNKPCGLRCLLSMIQFFRQRPFLLFPPNCRCPLRPCMPEVKQMGKRAA